MKTVRTVFGVWAAVRSWRHLTSLVAWLAAAVLCVLTQEVAGSPPLPGTASLGRELIATTFFVAERGPHERTWNRVETWRDDQGRTVMQTNRAYVELESGMHYWEDGQWKESQEWIEMYPDGAIARHGPHKVIFANNLNTAGAIDLELANGQRLRSHILGLSYFDSATGQSVLIAGVKDALGWLLPPNQVIYTNAFTNLNADVRYTYRKSGFAQDVILREQPSSPVEWGLNPATTLIQILTEFVDPPVPQIRLMAVNGASGLVDERLDFGPLKIGRGKAFSFGWENDSRRAVRVLKQWTVLEGRTFLVEEVPFIAVEPQLRALPENGTASLNLRPKGQGENAIAALGKHLPLPGASRKAGAVQVATLDVAAQPGLVLDYEGFSGPTNFTFKGDMTYYCTNTVNLYGTTVLEGGAVVKLGTNVSAKIVCWDDLACRTGPYRPAVFTAKDDNSVGEAITGSSGNPDSYGYYGGTALVLPNVYSVEATTPLRHVRFLYQRMGVDGNIATGYQLFPFSDLQFVKCQIAFNTYAYDFVFQNCLFANIGTNIYGPGYIRGEHLTFDQCGKLMVNWDPEEDSFMKLTNCLGVLITNWGINCTLTTNSSALFTNDPGVFQTVGAGAHYLADDTYRDQGTTNINANLLADLGKKTTYPPVEIATNITSDTVLSPRAQRDTDLPDLGYHYDPLDYVPYLVNVNHAVLTVEAGTALGFRGWDWGDGLTLGDTAQLVTAGQATNPCSFARYNTVQEQATTNWSSTSPGPFLAYSDTYPVTAPTVNCRFTEFSQLGGDIIAYGDGCVGTFSFRDCAFRGGNVYWSSAIGPAYSFTANVTNCLFERTGTYVYGGVPSLNVSAYNNLFWNGSVSLDDFDTSIPENGNTLIFQDNLFFETVISQTTNVSIAGSYNGYLTNCDRLTPTDPSDVVLTNLVFETGVLGSYYQPDSLLLNAGSTNADATGLYHYTTQTNQVKETNSTVDIGLHYVAVDGNGNPADSDGDGLADYLEDSNGNGSYEGGDLANWQDADTDYDGRSDSEEWNQENTSPLDAASFTPTRLAFFRFNDAAFSGERGQLPLATNALESVDAWITKGVQLTNSSALLKYRSVEADGTANINLRSGTVRFWFKPLWDSGGANAPGNAARLLEVGTPNSNGWWAIFFNTDCTSILFASQTNGATAATNLTAGVSFVSNNWYQIVLTYTNGTVALYTNGVQAEAGTGTLDYPGLSVRTNGFTVGSDGSANAPAKGVIEDLETYNYPLTTNDIVENFQLTQPPNLIPNLRLWLKADAEAIGSPNKISQWNDQTTNHFNAFQGTLNLQPLYATNWINGKPAIYFLGTNYLFLPNALFTNAAEAEVFIVLQSTATAPQGLWFLGPFGGSYPKADGTVTEDFGSTVLVDTGIPSQSLDQPHIYNVVAKPNEWTSRFNGVISFTKPVNIVQLRTNSVRLGNNSSTNFAGFISEVLVYARGLTAEERFAVGAYLGQRYNLVTNLPAAPTDLAAWAVSTNQISLLWSNALSNTNVSFTVQRRSAGGGYNTIAIMQDTLSFLDSDLASNTQYYYRVKAANFAGESLYSNETNATTLGSGITLPMASLKVWLKADGGHGGNPINCWVDQTTNNNSAYYSTRAVGNRPTWVETNMNGASAMYFAGTNSFYLPPFGTNWTQGEIFAVIKSLGTTNAQVGLWLMGAGGYTSLYPQSDGQIQENFGRGDYAVITGYPPLDIRNPHLYNVMSRVGSWVSRMNNIGYGSAVATNVGFNPDPRLGWGGSGSNSNFRGYISEIMIFDRELTANERATVSTNYLYNRFALP